MAGYTVSHVLTEVEWWSQIILDLVQNLNPECQSRKDSSLYIHWHLGLRRIPWITVIASELVLCLPLLITSASASLYDSSQSDSAKI